MVKRTFVMCSGFRGNGGDGPKAVDNTAQPRGGTNFRYTLPYWLTCFLLKLKPQVRAKLIRLIMNGFT